MTSGWLWLYFGAFLMLVEIFAPGFIIFFFGLAAATTGVLNMIIGDAFNATWQVSSFAAFSVLYLLFLRSRMKGVFLGNKKVVDTNVDDDYSGRIATVVTEIAPPLSGRVLLGDAEWEATADSFIAKDAKVKIISKNNITLKVTEV
jgi:membrane protein implicated in regulation of membrane protease activity